MNTFNDFKKQSKEIAIIGLGYVGLPLAIELSKHFKVTGYDIDNTKINELQKNIDRTNELNEKELVKSSVNYTSNVNDLKTAALYIVTVPTPINKQNIPDLTYLESASSLIASCLSKGNIVVYESTVFPGATEEVCIPILEKNTNLKANIDFFYGYSPERISPGDVSRTLTNVTKIVSGSNTETLNLLENIYGQIIKKGIYRAESIKVAEAAKVIENTQRDLNVALMNELSIIFNKMNINTYEVINAASSKWNFIKMTPGLVGGHCIGVDPYYLTYKAETLGYTPQVVLAGRRINNSMGKNIAEQLIKFLISTDKKIKNSKILIMGFTFKENVSDIRNSKVMDIVNELKEYQISPIIVDPMASKTELKKEYQLKLSNFNDIENVDAIIYAVPHDKYKHLTEQDLLSKIKGHKSKKIIMDIKKTLCLSPDKTDFIYWTL